MARSQEKPVAPAQSFSSKQTNLHQHNCTCGNCACGETSGRSPRPKSSANVASPPVGHDFGKLRVQAKLAVGAPDDEYEREADRVADQVMLKLDSPNHDPPVRITSAKGAKDARKPRGKPAEEPPASVSRAGMEDEEAQIPGSLQNRINDGQGSGQALSLPTQQMLAPLLGRDLSSVRVHTDPSAHRMAHELQAQAFTVGRHIYFGPGKYAPASAEGRRLLVHELAHTVQQAASSSPLVQTQLQETAPKKAPTKKVRRKIKSVTFYRDHGKKGLVVLELVDAPSIALEAIYNGGPNPGTYEIMRGGAKQDPEQQQKMGGTANEKGYVVEWVMPKDVTFEGVSSYTFTVTAGMPVETSKKAPADGGAGKAPSGKGGKPSKPGEVTDPASRAGAAPPKTPPQTGSEQAADTPAPPSDVLDKLKALPENIKALMGGEASFRPEDYERLLRIGQKLQGLSREDLEIYKLLATELTKDLDAFERSIDVYLQVKEHLKELAQAKKSSGEPTLEEKLAGSWEGVDLSTLGTLSPGEKEALAREMAAKQRNIQLEHMVTNPGETAVGMVEGLFRPDQVAKGIAEDLREAADGNKSGFARAAGLAGAYGKYSGYVAGVAGAVYVALLFVPGVNVIQLATTALVAGGISIGLAVAESELRIQAAKATKDPQEFMGHTVKAASAQANVVVQLAMIAVHLAAKLVARIPLKGNHKTVGDALAAARESLLKKTGVGPALDKVRAELLVKLKGARKGLPEALVEESKQLQDVSAKVNTMTGEKLLEELASGDPTLQDVTGILPETAKQLQAAAKTPSGAGFPEELRQNILRGIEDAPKEAAKTVDGFVSEVDRIIEAVEKAKTPAELESAVKYGEKSISPEELSKKALADQQGYLKDRIKAEIEKGADETPPESKAPAPATTEKSPPAEQKAPVAEEKAPAEPPKAETTTSEQAPALTPEAAKLTELERKYAELDKQASEAQKSWGREERRLAGIGEKKAKARGEARKQLEKEYEEPLKEIRGNIDKYSKEYWDLLEQRDKKLQEINSLKGPKIKPGKIKPGSKGLERPRARSSRGRPESRPSPRIRPRPACTAAAKVWLRTWITLFRSTGAETPPSTTRSSLASGAIRPKAAGIFRSTSPPAIPAPGRHPGGRRRSEWKWVQCRRISPST